MAATFTLLSGQKVAEQPAEPDDENDLAAVRSSRDSEEAKLSWLRSQIIGGNAEVDTPFGERRLTYADHTASGRCLHYIENYIIDTVLPFYGNCHTSDSYVGYQTTKMVHEAADYVKKCLGGGENDALLFCGSGSTAAIKRLQEVMGLAIPSSLRERMLKCLSNDERWVVFVGPFEHHSNLLSWRQSLAEVVEIGLDDDGLLDMEALRGKLELYRQTNRPMLGSFSACSNVTGICSDTRGLAQLLHSYGAFACFDFAARYVHDFNSYVSCENASLHLYALLSKTLGEKKQTGSSILKRCDCLLYSGPYVEIDMRSGEIDGYDAIFLSPHKFIGGPGSPGILLMSKALYQLKSSPPSTCGGGTVDFVNNFNENDTLYVTDIEEREDAGTPPIIQKIRAALAFWVKDYIGYSVIMKREQNYIKRALERFLPNQNIRVLGNTSDERQAILSFLVNTTKYSSSTKLSTKDNGDGKDLGGLYMSKETGDKRDKPLHGPFVAKLLNDLFGIQARGGCACAGPYGHHLLNIDEPSSLAFRSAIEMGYNGVKPGWTRISFPYYMSNEEFEFILAAVEFIAIYGQRFLPLYHFNWKIGVWNFKMKVLKETLREKENTDFKFCISTLSNTMRDLKVEYNELKEQKNIKTRCVDDVVICKYASYLKTAKHIADLLPKFPSPRRVPEDIDQDIVLFKV